MMLLKSDLARAVGENEIEFTAGTLELPFPQRIHNECRKRDRAISRPRLRFADRVEAVRALPDVKLVRLEVHIPHVSPRSSEARKPVKAAVTSNGRQRPAACEQSLDLVGGGNIPPTFKLTFVPLRLGARVAPVPAQIPDGVPGRQALLLRVGNSRAKARNRTADHRRRAD